MYTYLQTVALRLVNAERRRSVVCFHGTHSTAVKMVEVKITDDIKVGGNNPCFIIAEVGQNHQGDIEIAKKLIKAAKVSNVLFHSRSDVFRSVYIHKRRFVLLSRTQQRKRSVTVTITNLCHLNYPLLLALNNKRLIRIKRLLSCLTLESICFKSITLLIKHKIKLYLYFVL